MAGSPKDSVLPGHTEAVLLDAFGTLIGLDPPVPRLRAALAAAGHRYDHATVARAFTAEVAHYRAHHMRGGTPTGLAQLRLECAAVMGGHLGPGAPDSPELSAILVAGLRFRLFPDAVPALDGLRARGLRLALVSNWDMSLPAVLDGLGIADRFETVTVSAVCGVAKPDPAIYALTLRAMGLAPGRVVHVGDDLRLDGAGAAAAGVRPVIIGRPSARPDAVESITGFTCIEQLTELCEPRDPPDRVRDDGPVSR